MTRAICRLYAKGIISFARAKPSDPIDRPRALEAGAAVVTGVLPWRGGCWPNHCCSESPALGFLQFRAASMVLLRPISRRGAVREQSTAPRREMGRTGVRVSTVPLAPEVGPRRRRFGCFAQGVARAGNVCRGCYVAGVFVFRHDDEQRGQSLPQQSGLTGNPPSVSLIFELALMTDVCRRGAGLRCVYRAGASVGGRRQELPGP